jgi:hypothetical protein
MEMMLQATGQGQAWVPIDKVVVNVRPQPDKVYRVGMLAGRVDVLLGIVSRN